MVDVLSEREKKTGELFSKLFPAYDDKAFLASLELFQKRFDENNFPLEWFENKVILDAGCGGGRYSLAVSLLGAKEVKGIDLGKASIADAENRKRKLGISNVEFMVGSVENIPFPDNYFDGVIFSGVLQHLGNPCAVVDEISRVVRKGGMVYLLVYATEGVRWPLVQILRPIAQKIGFEEMDRILDVAGFKVNRRRTYLDDMFVPYIDFYSWQCLKGILNKAGFDEIFRWKAGRLDHEESLGAYHKDLLGFYQIFHAFSEQYIAAGLTEHKAIIDSAVLLSESAVKYIETMMKQVKNGEISNQEAMNMVVGQGHHRVIAWKQ